MANEDRKLAAFKVFCKYFAMMAVGIIAIVLDRRSEDRTNKAVKETKANAEACKAAAKSTADHAASVKASLSKHEIILARAATPASTSVATSAATSTVTPASTSTAISAATSTVTPASTSVATSAATSTVTPAPTSTAISAATSTVTPVSTSVATSAATSAATSTVTPAPTSTATSTVTPASTSTAISAATSTVTPASTSTAISTVTPASTSTATSTATSAATFSSTFAGRRNTILTILLVVGIGIVIFYGVKAVRQDARNENRRDENDRLFRMMREAITSMNIRRQGSTIVLDPPSDFWEVMAVISRIAGDSSQLPPHIRNILNEMRRHVQIRSNLLSNRRLIYISDDIWNTVLQGLLVDGGASTSGTANRGEIDEAQKLTRDSENEEDEEMR